jgi:hypothetical protein
MAATGRPNRHRGAPHRRVARGMPGIPAPYAPRPLGPGRFSPPSLSDAHSRPPLPTRRFMVRVVMARLQAEQMMVLPGSFFGHGGIGIRGRGGPMDSLQGIDRGAERMRANMSRGYRLTRGTSGRTSRIILTHLARGSMRIERSLADGIHPKHPGSYPCSECFERSARALIFWMHLLKERHDTLSTVECPESQYLMGGRFHQLYRRLISKTGECRCPLHVLAPVVVIRSPLGPVMGRRSHGRTGMAVRRTL